MSEKATLRTKLDWHWYWQVTRRRQKIAPAIAHALPVWLKRRVYIDVLADATTKPPLDRQAVPEVRAMDVMNGWY